jgi:hypothetical protein
VVHDHVLLHLEFFPCSKWYQSDSSSVRLAAKAHARCCR